MRRVLFGLLGVAVVVSLTGTPAQAQTKVRRDARGDVGRTWDLRTVTVQNNARNYALTVRIADVRRNRTSVATSILPASARRAGRNETIRYFLLSTLAVSRTRWLTSLDLVTQDGTGPDAELVSVETVTCPGFRTRIRTGRRGFIRTTIPQRCLGDLAGRNTTYPTTYDSEETTEADGLRLRTRALRGDAPDDDLFDTLPGDGVTTRRGR